MAGFEELHVWQEARALCKDLREDFLNNTNIHDYPLKDQVNRSSGSMMDNVAEGYGRGGNREFIQFLYIARGSANELKSQIYRAFDRAYFEKEQFEAYLQKITSYLKQLNGFITYLKRSEVQGAKYKTGEAQETYGFEHDSIN